MPPDHAVFAEFSMCRSITAPVSCHSSIICLENAWVLDPRYRSIVLQANLALKIRFLPVLLLNDDVRLDLSTTITTTPPHNKQATSLCLRVSQSSQTVGKEHCRKQFPLSPRRRYYCIVIKTISGITIHLCSSTNLKKPQQEKQTVRTTWHGPPSYMGSISL
jgi:hypothetical protein